MTAYEMNILSELDPDTQGRHSDQPAWPGVSSEYSTGDELALSENGALAYLEGDDRLDYLAAALADYTRPLMSGGAASLQ